MLDMSKPFRPDVTRVNGLVLCYTICRRGGEGNSVRHGAQGSFARKTARALPCAYFSIRRAREREDRGHVDIYGVSFFRAAGRTPFHRARMRLAGET